MARTSGFFGVSKPGPYLRSTFCFATEKKKWAAKTQQILPHPKKSKPFVGRAVMALSTLAAAVQGVTPASTTRILRGGGGKTGDHETLNTGIVIGNCISCSYPMDSSKSERCVICQSPVCNICLIDGQCPGCCYDMPSERDKLDWSDANVVQNGQDVSFKTGQITKLTKNLEGIGVMAEHNLKPTFVARALDQVPIREAHVLSRDNQVDPTPWNTYFTECCCPMDSKLMEYWFKQGGRGERVGKEMVTCRARSLSTGRQVDVGLELP